MQVGKQKVDKCTRCRRQHSQSLVMGWVRGPKNEVRKPVCEKKKGTETGIRRDKTVVLHQFGKAGTMLHKIAVFYIFKSGLTKRICIVSGRWIWINSHHPLMVIKVRDDKNRETPQVLTFLHSASSSSLYLSALLPNYSFTPRSPRGFTPTRIHLTPRGLLRDFCHVPAHLSDSHLPDNCTTA